MTKRFDRNPPQVKMGALSDPILPSKLLPEIENLNISAFPQKENAKP